MLPTNAPTRADALLAVIGTALAAAAAAAHVTALPFALAGGLCLALAGTAMVDGLLVHPPGDG
ncbi:hypothetical protein [Halorarum halobium]|uniref:hypothetical protein n=1 Tax=Halorarum halobium TaxID=3075121 RepID=UPI0028AF2123|nr:hypothetical protein [Halobaculum sp. XH14]